MSRTFQAHLEIQALVYFEGGDLDALARTDRETLIQAVNVVRRLPTVNILAHALSAYPAPPGEGL